MKWYRPVEPKELHANGEATEDELTAAEAAAGGAAWDAAWGARAASDAGHEMKRRQETELRRICGEG